MLSQNQRTTILELHAQGVSKREIARVLNISRLSVRKVLRANSAEVPKLLRPEKAEPYRQQILELLDSCKGNLVRVQEELAAQRSASVVLDPDRLLPPAWHRTTAHRAVRKLPFPARRRNSARHLSARARAERQAPQGANGLGGPVLFAHVVLPDVSHLSTFRLQGVSHRSLALLRGCADSRGDRQHSRGGVAWHRARDGSRPRDGGFCRAFRLPVHGSRARGCQPFGPRRTAVLVRGAELPSRTPLHQLAGFEPTGSPVVRSRERHLQETYSRRAARVVCGGTTTSETAARVDSRGLSPARTDRGRRRLRRIE